MQIDAKTIQIIRTSMEKGMVTDQRKVDNAGVLQLFETLASAAKQAKILASNFGRRKLPQAKTLSSIALMSEVLSGQVFEIKLDIEPDKDE